MEDQNPPSGKKVLESRWFSAVDNLAKPFSGVFRSHIFHWGGSLRCPAALPTLKTLKRDMSPYRILNGYPIPFAGLIYLSSLAVREDRETVQPNRLYPIETSVAVAPPGEADRMAVLG